jgi:hypothetical protein
MDGYDVDVFVHSWYDPKEVGQEYRHGLWHDREGIHPGTVEAGSDEAILELYKPKRHIIEPQRDFAVEASTCMNIVERHVTFPDWAKGNPRFMFNILSMYYSIAEDYYLYKCNTITFSAENQGTHYDAVVRCRFDMQINEKVRYETLDLSKISTSWTYWLDYGGVCDLLAVGSPRDMATYCDVYYHMQHLCEVTEDPAPGHRYFGWGTESLLAQHLKEYNVETVGSVLNAINVRKG